MTTVTDDDRRLRVGTIAPVDLAAGPDKAAAVLAAMAGAGIDHLVVGDHVSFFVGFGVDGLVQATALSMLHPTLPVYTGVYLLPLRHPVLVARQLSTLSAIAPGRLVFGVGIGGEDRHEVEVCGVDPRTRGSRMEESLTVLRRLLAGEAVTFHGQHFDLDSALVLPAPSKPVPIVVGGRSDAAVRRAGRLGDGWLGLWVSPDRFEGAVAAFAEEASAAGRVGVRADHAMTVWCGFGADRADARAQVAGAMEAVYRLPFERFERYTPYGTPHDVAEALQAYRDKGCATFNLLARAASADDVIAGVAEVRRLLARTGR